jgi:hypothetical protein
VPEAEADFVLVELYSTVVKLEKMLSSKTMAVAVPKFGPDWLLLTVQAPFCCS